MSRNPEGQGSETKEITNVQAQLRVYLEKRHRLFCQTLRVKELLSLHQTAVFTELEEVLQQYGVPPPKPSQPAIERDGKKKFLIDRAKRFAYSDLLRRSRLTLPDFIRLVRGETAGDPRPNKALSVPDHLPCWSSYRYKNEWREIVAHVITDNKVPAARISTLEPCLSQKTLNAVIKNLRKGQDDGRYLILDRSFLLQVHGVAHSELSQRAKSR
ncbi:LOW QUALITY PROTEIN: hypothetical protein PHMEG_00010153 [Phytophthora megakarya]|uniref:Uncharacterized protein n=1 Tax=Phytophthora megakarya TaxID=4795 RepID=A0A225WEZ5_9STRA|nr:LOW QUALITY PROTEIN: hypothetical protein PHMEG_00010153 [Phytophthora megakarya]